MTAPDSSPTELEAEVATVLEIVADAIHRSDCGCSDWHADDQEDVIYREHAQAVLDALAPLFAAREARARADGWDDGYLRGTLDATCDLDPADNPYRERAEGYRDDA